MKRLILSLAAVAAVAGPMAATATTAQAQGYYRDHRDRRDYRGPDRYDRRDWDRGRHNGYYYGDRWNYGPPPQAYYGNPYYRPGYSQWRRGAPLPAYYRGYPMYDYGRHRLRQPPRGYAWYRAGNDYVLAAIATGIIFEIINNN
ncbi:RcnB family protein [Phenylobacterium sp.]|uniref:RcnB family protein n=1 Tax=Phenylobacterium sp. TaxID=1871053 RepID=UPI002734B432|nr:RcnB family protein [Phenylobacterium sp.]MDP3634377.1 RcnB family protein [Phenylobacterium sp.]HQT51983.1 RcnB family protein [Phenylobacterium sp.]